jgi:hypothetical protein
MCEFWCLLLEWSYDDTKPQKYTSLELKISTIWGHLPDGAGWTIFRSYQLDLGSQTELWIQDMERLFDNAYLVKVLNNKKWWHMRMEVLNLIYDHFFFITNNLGLQPTTSQYFQPLTP